MLWKIIKNVINVFIHAKMEDRIDRAVAQYGIDINKAEDIIIKTDKKRASYYNFYSSKKWGNVDNYDITVDSSVLGIDDTVKLLKEFVE